MKVYLVEVWDGQRCMIPSGVYLSLEAAKVDNCRADGKPFQWTEHTRHAGDGAYRVWSNRSGDYQITEMEAREWDSM